MLGLKFQIMSEWSPLEETSCFMLGLNAHAVTPSLCPRNVRSSEGSSLCEDSFAIGTPPNRTIAGERRGTARRFAATRREEAPGRVDATRGRRGRASDHARARESPDLRGRASAYADAAVTTARRARRASRCDAHADGPSRKEKTSDRWTTETSTNFLENGRFEKNVPVIFFSTSFSQQNLSTPTRPFPARASAPPPRRPRAAPTRPYSFRARRTSART